MLKGKLILKFIIVFLMVFTINSCIKDKFDFDKMAKQEWNPEVVAPMVYSRLTLSDFIKTDSSSYIHTDNDGLLYLYYKTNIISVEAPDLFTIPNQDTSIIFGLSTQDSIQLGSNGELAVALADTFKFTVPNDDYGDELEIDNIAFKGGNIVYSISSDYRNPIEISLSIPSIKNAQNQPFHDDIIFNWNGVAPLPLVKYQSINLDNYIFDLSTGSLKNGLLVNYTIKITDNGYPILKTDSIRINLDVDNIDFDYITGYLGQWDFDLAEDNIELSVFNNSTINGEISLADPKVNIYLNNYIGLPFHVKFDKLKAENDASSIDFQYQGNTAPTFSVNAPTQINDSAQTIHNLNKNTSNIVNIISSKPKKVTYKVTAKSNPFGKPATNFVTSSGKFKADLEVELPLDGAAKNFGLIDTIDINLESLEEIESAKLNLNIDNFFPIDIDVQLYFTNENYVVLDSLFNENSSSFYRVVSSGSVNSSGIVTAPTSKKSLITLSDAKLSSLTNSKFIIVKVNFSTTDNGSKNVKFYSNYYVDVKLGVNGNFNINMSK